MVDTGVGTPINNIVLQGNVPVVSELGIKTVANCYPGRLVSRDTTDYGIKACASSGDPVVGWLGYEQASIKTKPATIGTIYVIGDEAPVLSGGGFVIYGTLAQGESVTKGDPLKSAAAGMVAKATAGTDDVVGEAFWTVNATSSATVIAVKSRI